MLHQNKLQIDLTYVFWNLNKYTYLIHIRVYYYLFLQPNEDYDGESCIIHNTFYKLFDCDGNYLGKKTFQKS